MKVCMETLRDVSEINSWFICNGFSLALAPYWQYTDIFRKSLGVDVASLLVQCELKKRRDDVYLGDTFIIRLPLQVAYQPMGSLDTEGVGT